EEGSYNIAVTIKDVDGSTLKTNRTTVSVADAPITDTTPGRTLRASHGKTTGSVVLAYFTDCDPVATASTFSIAVNWGGRLTGNPTVSLKLVSRSSSGSVWEVLGSTIYANQGTYQISVSVVDVDGSAFTSKKTQFCVT